MDDHDDELDIINRHLDRLLARVLELEAEYRSLARRVDDALGQLLDNEPTLREKPYPFVCSQCATPTSVIIRIDKRALCSSCAKEIAK